MKATTIVSTQWARHWPALALIVIIAIAWFAYLPALTGTFLLDDLPTLGDLQNVDDTESALRFISSGFAGPLGRPIALASFLPQASAIGVNAEPFLRINILIHLLNGILVFAFARRLGRIALRNQQSTPFLPLSVAAMWLFMPLLASSSLLIVQRMTTLSATFVLGGLIAYLIARQRLESKPRNALLLMSLALAGATLLATLTKENGALLPVFVLVLEASILTPPKSLSKLHWNAWRGIFLATPAVLILVFLALQIPYSDETLAKRDFTLSERLFSEALILWEYLFNAFVGWAGQLGPFHDSHRVYSVSADPWIIVPAAVWILAISTAIRMRRHYPVAAFAILWFLVGHLLESTTIPLELYFEHRNYLPIIGPVFAVCYGIFTLKGRHHTIARAALGTYIIINAVILIGVSSLWGNPLLAATYWHERDPASVRAATNLAAQQLSTTGPDNAINTLREFARLNPEHGYVRIPELNLECTFRPQENHAALVEHLESELSSVAYMVRTGEMLDQLLSASITTECESVNAAVVADLASAVMRNPRYSKNNSYNQFHHMLMARLANMSGDVDRTLKHLYRAIDYRPSDDLSMMVVTTLVAAARFEEARKFMDDAQGDLPRMPLNRYNTKRNLEELRVYVDESEKLAGRSEEQRSGD
jgi:hypothetical protein